MADSTQATPFLRWAGGKRKLVRHLLRFAPEEFDTYWEPFLGAAALFFALRPPNSRLSDSNSDLIHCYKWVCARPALIYRYLREHLARSSETYYYRIRKTYNESSPSVAQAARFIYLNGTSFNGIFRVNLDGQFNVPYGRKEPPHQPSILELRNASRQLSTARIRALGYLQALTVDGPSPRDFVYLDPPYPPLNGTAYFRHYTSERFSWEDHAQVAAVAHALADNGTYVMVSNADLPQVRKLYRGWSLHQLPVVRWIAASGTRYEVSELVITSYKVAPGNGQRHNAQRRTNERKAD